MKRKIIVTSLVFLLITALALPSALAITQDIGDYSGASLWYDSTNVYPTSRYRYGDYNDPMIDNNESTSEYDTGYSPSYYSSAVSTSTGERVTYEYVVDSGERQHMFIQYSAPVGEYYRLRHRSYGYYNFYIVMVGTWAPNDNHNH